MTTPVTLDIWSDVVCPWCWVGKRRLEIALDAEAADAAARGEPAPPVELRFHAFELRPDMPEGGADAVEFYSRLFGSPDRWVQAGHQMEAIGAEVGLPFDYPRIRRAANTRLAHRIIAIADDAGHGPAVLDAFHRAYFADGRDVNDREVLLEVLAGAGTDLDIDEVRERILAGEAAERVRDDERLAAQLGITGVPMFVAGLDAGRPVGVSGAQPPEVMRRLLEVAREQQLAGAAAEA
ncbi:MAG: DsbA family oxidoreductase [Chloroflexota bacterium]